MLRDEQVKAYLERIGFDGEPKINRKTLDALVYAHQCSVPFETIGVHRRGGAPSTQLEDLYDKIVMRRLGGYCFELNKLFEELLRALGFKVRPVLSRAVRGREGRMPINHRGIVVELPEGTYSVDVGFGGPMPAGALLIAGDGAEDDQLIEGETFRVVDKGNGWLAIERITRANFDTYDDEVPERRQVELEVCLAEVEEQDFAALNMFFAQPGTLFRDHDVVNLRTPGGYLGLKDDVLTIRDNGSKQVIKLENAAAVDVALAKHFGMSV